jgi:hypothetical protein
MFGFRGQGKGLAVMAVLIGLGAPAHAADERFIYASLGEVTRAPIIQATAAKARANRATS